MNQRARLSLLVVQIFIFSLLFGLMVRLFYLQVAAGPKYRDAALSIQRRDVVTQFKLFGGGFSLFLIFALLWSALGTP